jgi:hypothetical protein
MHVRACKDGAPVMQVYIYTYHIKYIHINIMHIQVPRMRAIQILHLLLLGGSSEEMLTANFFHTQVHAGPLYIFRYTYDSYRGGRNISTPAAAGGLQQ